MNGSLGQAEAFCERLLPQVSRTFALGIAALPLQLRRPTMTGYLLCRVADTLEDQTSCPREVRAGALRAWRNEVVVATRQGVEPTSFGVNPAFLPPLPPVATTPWPNGLATSVEAEQELLSGRHHVLSLLRHLPADVRHLLAWQLGEMTVGMQEFLQSEGHYPIGSFGQLERYCYYVAGTVGLMLTGLFSAGSESIPAARLQVLRDTATSFGIALQLVNVIKDAAGDLVEYRCFLPQDLWPADGLPLGRRATPKEQPGLRALLLALVQQTVPYLQNAQRYLLALPPERRHARRFCALPLHLALHTLVACQTSEELADASRPVKLPRSQVARVLGWVETHLDDDVELQREFEARLGQLQP